MGSKGEVGSPMTEFVVGLEFNVGDETFAVKIVRKWGWSIVGGDFRKRCIPLLKIQCSLTLGSVTRS